MSGPVKEWNDLRDAAMAQEAHWRMLLAQGRVSFEDDRERNRRMDAHRAAREPADMSLLRRVPDQQDEPAAKRRASDDDDESADSADSDVWACVSCGRCHHDCDMHTVSIDTEGHAVRVCGRCKPQCDYCGHCMRRFLPPGLADDADPEWQRAETGSETAQRMSDASDGKLSLNAARYRYNEKFYHASDCVAACTHCYHEAPIARTGEILHVISDLNDDRRRSVKRDIYSCQLVCKDRKACKERWHSSPRVRADVRAMLGRK